MTPPDAPKPAATQQSAPKAISAPPPPAKSKSSSLVLVAILVVVVGGGGWYLTRGKSSEPMPARTAAVETSPPSSPATEAPRPLARPDPIAQGAPAAKTNEPATPLSLVETALDAVRRKDETAIQTALNTIKTLPAPVRGDRTAARAANAAGLAHLQASRSSQAIESFRQGVAADPTDQEIFNNLGFALSGVGQEDEAIAAYVKAIALSPDRSLAWSNLAMSYTKKDQIDKGVSAYVLAYRFSANQERTRGILLRQSQESQDPRLRDLSARVVKALEP